MPESDTSKATTAMGLIENRMPGAPTGHVAGDTFSQTPPCSVNLKALERRFFEHLLQAL